ncbi:MAG: hypothetical protein AAF850_07660 [Pseudomonadota bacterium]
MDTDRYSGQRYALTLLAASASAKRAGATVSEGEVLSEVITTVEQAVVSVVNAETSIAASALGKCLDIETLYTQPNSTQYVDRQRCPTLGH